MFFVHQLVTDLLGANFVDLRTAQVYCDPFFFGQQESVSKFPPFLWAKLWVGCVGRGMQKLADIFPHRGLIGLLSSQRKKLLYSLRF